MAACRLINTSLIPMTFYLRVPSDGTGHLASSIAGSFLSDAYIDESYLHQPPIEFEIYPNTGTIGPQSEIEIQVTCDIKEMISLYEKDMSIQGVANCLKIFVSVIGFF